MGLGDEVPTPWWGAGRAVPATACVTTGAGCDLNLLRRDRPGWLRISKAADRYRSHTPGPVRFFRGPGCTYPVSPLRRGSHSRGTSR
jgi:hypothetical protein